MEELHYLAAPEEPVAIMFPVMFLQTMENLFKVPCRDLLLSLIKSNQNLPLC